MRGLVRSYVTLAITLRKGKVVGSEKVKFWDVVFIISKEEKLRQGFSVYDRN
jgi:hypothetical protein